jgi:hypothetical protein
MADMGKASMEAEKRRIAKLERKDASEKAAAGEIGRAD